MVKTKYWSIMKKITLEMYIHEVKRNGILSGFDANNDD
jgi:hypothetical protein